MASSESRVVWITLSDVFLSIRSENEERESLREGFRLPTGRITGEKFGIIGELGDDFGSLRVNALLLGALCPSKSGLMNKHIVNTS
jgi:hypothetical protein